LEGITGFFVTDSDGLPFFESCPEPLDDVAVLLIHDLQATGASLRFGGIAGLEPLSQINSRTA
jgi:hypothetical protein